MKTTIRDLKVCALSSYKPLFRCDSRAFGLEQTSGGHFCPFGQVGSPDSSLGHGGRGFAAGRHDRNCFLTGQSDTGFTQSIDCLSELGPGNVAEGSYER